MARDAEELAHHHADGHGPVRHLDARELLHGEAVGQVVHHAAEVVNAVGVGDIGVPGLALGHFFGAAVVIADVEHGVGDLFAVELEDEADKAVGAGVLGTEIQEHEVRVCRFPLHAPVFGFELERGLFFLFLFIGQLKRAHLRGACGMVLAQGMPLPGRRHQYPLQMRMAVELYPEHVPYLAFVPVR